MRGNRVKEKLNKGEVAIAVGGHSNTSDTIDFMGPLGFDGIWLEGEHGSVSWGGIGDLSRACDLWGMASVARLHQNDPGVITRVLDLGVNGIVVPHVSSRAEAERVVESAYFAPVGRRGIFSGRRSYGASDFHARANLETLVIVLIDGRDLESLASRPARIVDIFEREARHALELEKRDEVAEQSSRRSASSLLHSAPESDRT